MKKILLLTNLYPTDYAPFRASFNRAQFSRLSKVYKIDIFIPVKLKEFYHLLVKKTETPAVNNIEIKSVLFLYIPKILRSLQPLFLLIPFLMNSISLRKKKYNCVIGSWAFPDGVVAALLSKLFKLPVIIKVHGTDINIFMKDNLRRKIIIWSMKQASSIVCVSQALKNILIQSGIPENKIHVIYNGVDQEIFPYSPPATNKKPPLILFIGNIITTKGVIELYEAYKELVKTTDIKLCFIGDGDMKEKLISLTSGDNLNEKITFTGRLEQDKISELIQSCTLVCLPSYNEGVPNVLLEAKSCGRPVVATTVGGIPEIINENDGVLIAPKSKESVIDGIKSALSTKWNHQEIHNNAKKYDWNNNINALSTLIERATNKQSNV